MENGNQSFRLRTPGLAERLLYGQIIRRAGWDCSLGRLIAHGGMASVYELDTPDGKPRVVKVIDTRLIVPELRQIVRQHGLEECTVMGQLSRESQYIMPLYASTWSEVPEKLFDTQAQRERIYLLQMPRARSLCSVAKDILPERELIQLGMDISSALQVCYDQNRIHRDVKPENIFLRQHGGRRCYILGDFGIAREVNEKTLTGVGTENYLAPELCVGWISRNSDIYSLGVTLFALAGGRFCSGSPNNGLARGSRVDWQDFTDRTTVSEPLRNIIHKALQDHHNRYRQPCEMYEDLWWLQKQMRQ